MTGARFVVRLVSILVPSDRRERWVDEWVAELHHYEVHLKGGGRSASSTAARVCLRAIESVGDAAWLRWRQGPPGSTGLVRHSLVGLVRRPSFTLSVIATLGLGLGASTAIFTLADALLLRPLPFPEPERLVVVSDARSPNRGVDAESLDFWREQDRLFLDVRARVGTSVVLTGAGQARSYRAESVEPGFLDVLGVRPILGRPFTADDAAGEARVVLLADEVWREAFARDRDVVGRSIELNGEAHTVIGVLPPGVRRMPGGLVHLLLPMREPPFARLTTLARLHPDIPIDVAQQRVRELWTGWSEERGLTDSGQVTLFSLDRGQGSETRNGLLALAAAVACLFLTACANAAGLLLLRGATRTPEFQLRAAIGASRYSLVGLVLVESLILAMAAGAFGLLVAWWSVRGLLGLMPSTVVRFSYNPISIDERVFAFGFALTVLTGLAFGLVPAMRAGRAVAARAGRTVTASGSDVRLRAMLQVTQVALAMLLLVGAGLFGRSFERLMDDDPGYDPASLVALELTSLERLRGQERTTAAAQALDERLRGLPGVAGVTRSGGTGFLFDYTLETEERPAWDPPTIYMPHQYVDTAFFNTMGIALRAGRGFVASDVDNGALVIIDEDLADALWPNEPAVGRRFRTRDDEWLTVIGVTENVKLDGPIEPFGPYYIFYPASPEELRNGTVAIRSVGDPRDLTRPIRATVSEVDPDQPIRSLLTGTEVTRETVADTRLLAVITRYLAVAGLLLAVVGVYGFVSFSVAQRHREIGIRVALGADIPRVVGAVFRSGLGLGMVGVATGLVGVFAASRFLPVLLYETQPLDPLVIAFAATALLVACAGALLGPAHRAASADPADTLRSE
ncbi:MAG: ADOP family duplicated permease [Gemmatimonadota bacterium]